MDVSEKPHTFICGTKRKGLLFFDEKFTHLRTYETEAAIKDIVHDRKSKKLYVVVWNRTLLALNLSGKLITSKRFTYYPVRLALCGSEKHIYIGGNEGQFSCLDENGETLFEDKLTDTINSMKHDPKTHNIYISTCDGNLYCYKKQKKLWTYKLDNMPVAIDYIPETEIIIVALENGKILALDNHRKIIAETVTKKTITYIEHYVSIKDEPYICVGTYEGELYLFDRNLRLQNQYNCESEITGIKISGKNVYVSTLNGHIYTLVWHDKKEGEIFYELMCIGEKCGTFISTDFRNTCPRCLSGNVVSRIIIE